VYFVDPPHELHAVIADEGQSQSAKDGNLLHQPVHFGIPTAIGNEEALHSGVERMLHYARETHQRKERALLVALLKTTTTTTVTQSRETRT